RATPLGELRRRGLREEERRAQVGADEVVPFARADALEWRRVERRGVVDEAVEAAESRGRFVDELRKRGEVEKIGLHHDARTRSRGIELGGDAPGLVARAVAVQRDVRSRGV